MFDFLDRTEKLIGSKAINKLASSHVAVFGLGGVGGACAEALVRSGIGKIDVIDKDVVDITNINRQIIATHDTVGKNKTDVAFERLKSINPACEINAIKKFYLPENSSEFEFAKYDYVVDCIDNVTAKLSIIEECEKAGTKIISSMGTGNKLDPTRFEISDINKTSVCPLAKVVRTECRKRGIKKLKVLYSKEEPARQGERTPASVSFVPPVAGMIIAGEVIKDLIK